MLTITSISREKRKYIIDCDGELTVTLDADTFELAGLEPGDEVDEALLTELASRSAYKAARQKALYAIGRRELCRGGLIQLLTRGDCDRETASQVADEMEQLGFINDTRYAGMLAEYLYRDKHFGHRRVVMEMISKGLDREQAEIAAEQYRPDPAEALDELLDGRIGRELNTQTGVRRAMNNLLRYGYYPGEIRAAIQRRVGGEDDF
ncbi:MAG: hypothetical protein E7554_07900 [Ruminococcaceae bacterium]|nr:hypothetical protein [Oscillospiraceae bacterium]